MNLITPNFNALSMAYIGYYKQCLQGLVKSVVRWPCARPRAAFGLAACIAYNVTDVCEVELALSNGTMKHCKII